MADMKDRLGQVTTGVKRRRSIKPAIVKNSSEDKSKPHYRPSRAGKKAITGRFDPAVSKQIKGLAVDEDTSVEALLGEALNMLFESRKLPQIAPMPESPT